MNLPTQQQPSMISLFRSILGSVSHKACRPLRWQTVAQRNCVVGEKFSHTREILCPHDCEPDVFYFRWKPQLLAFPMYVRWWNCQKNSPMFLALHFAKPLRKVLCPTSVNLDVLTEMAQNGRMQLMMGSQHMTWVPRTAAPPPLTRQNPARLAARRPADFGFLHCT